MLADYGTGAIMAVPGQDQRDWDFAKKFDLPIIRTVRPPDDFVDDAAYIGQGPAMNSHNDEISLDGMDIAEAKTAIIAWLERQGAGRGTVNFRLRDWLLSRQRYWGAPIPIIHCPVDGEVPVADDQLPVVLPELRGADLTPRGVSPLAAAEDWVNVECPKCGGPAKRDSDTMDTFVDSSWYFLRYCSPHADDKPFDTDLVNAWGPCDVYIGGVEHAVLHLLYARFFTMVLNDMGLVGLPRAVLRPAEPGHGHQPRRQDVEVQGQRRPIGGTTIGLRRGRGTADPDLRGTSRGRHRLGRHVPVGVAAVPAAGVAAER